MKNFLFFYNEAWSPKFLLNSQLMVPLPRFRIALTTFLAVLTVRCILKHFINLKFDECSPASYPLSMAAAFDTSSMSFHSLFSMVYTHDCVYLFPPMFVAIISTLICNGRIVLASKCIVSV